MVSESTTFCTQSSGNQMKGPSPSQGPQVTSSNLLQSLNQRPILQNQMSNLQSNINQIPQGHVMTGTVGSQMNISVSSQGDQMINPGVGSGSGNINIPISMSSGGTLQNQMFPPMSSTQVPNVLPSNQMSGLGMVQSQMSHIHPRKGHDGLSGQSGFIGPCGTTPNVFMRQNTIPLAPQPQPSPAGSSVLTSPGMATSNTSQLTPNPITGGSNFRVGSSNLVPSPSSVSLNTPSHYQHMPSPSNNDDLAYHEKVKQLSKYIEPLRTMIAGIGNDENEKLSKMKKLLEILSIPGKRMPLETLLKCEVVLEKLDFKRQLDDVAPPSFAPFRNPLIETASVALQSPHVNHTLHRTFGPALEALHGPPIANMPRPIKRKKPEEPQDDIPEVLQGEIARLDQRFKVCLDPKHQIGSKSIRLLCWLHDKHLPCVPPIQIMVPEDYPMTPPIQLLPDEYDATPYLSKVKLVLTKRISHFPSKFSISQILDSWELSVRQACDRDYDPSSEDAFFEQFNL